MKISASYSIHVPIALLMARLAFRPLGLRPVKLLVF